MNVSLTPELEKFVQERVKTGLYRSSSEVVREALRLLHEQERIREARRQQLGGLLDVGIKQLDAGQSNPMNNELLEDIKSTARTKRKSR